MNKYYFLYITIFNLIFALPRFGIQDGSSCIACHVNPTGSGMRNDYGTNIISLEELPLKRWIKQGDENWDGYITDQIQLGGDFRLQGIHYNNSDTTSKTAFFPMQADIYALLNLNQKASIFTKIGARGKKSLSTEFWIMVNDLPQNSWFKIGKALPNYGMRVDDHTSFIRGGNYSRTTLGLKKEGLIFDPYLDPPAIFEFGIKILSNLHWTSSISTNIISSDEEIANLSTQLNYSNSFNNIGYMFGTSYMKENYFQMRGIYAGIAIKNLVYTFEVDQAENWIDGSKSIAIYDEIAWEVFQGLHLIGKYDFFDPQIDILSGSISRFSIGAEIYPLNVMEIKLQIRKNDIDLENIKQPKPEFLVQTHFWF